MVGVWDARQRRRVGEVPSRAGRVFAVTFCGNRLLALGGSGEAISVCDAATGQERYRLSGHTGTVAALAFHPAGATLVSGGFDTTVRLWRIDVPDALPVASRPGGARAAE